MNINLLKRILNLQWPANHNNFEMFKVSQQVVEFQAYFSEKSITKMCILLRFIIKENLCHTTCLRKEGKVKDRARDIEKASKSGTVFKLKEDHVREREQGNAQNCHCAAILPTLTAQCISSSSPSGISLLNHLS